MQADNSYSPGLKDFSYNEDMDPVRALIVRKADELGETLSSLSKKAGKNHAYLQQFVRRGVPEELPEKVRGRLAELIRVPERELRAGGGEPALPGLPVAVAPRNAMIGGPVQFGPTIPLYGQAAAGKDGRFILNGNRVADILAPPVLAGVRDAYAVYVVGESMEPRYFPGEAVFVNPRAPVRRGDFVVAQVAADEGEAPFAFIKRFVSRDARALRLEQLNPRKILEFPAQKIVSVHRIVMGGDR